MSAVKALKAARATGVKLGIEGDGLVLEAATAPPSTVLDLLTRHKAGIMALLRPANDGWSGEDWLTFIEERAGIAEFDGGLPRQEAEVRAFDLLRSRARGRVENALHATAQPGCPFVFLKPKDAIHRVHRCSDGIHAFRRERSCVLLSVGRAELVFVGGRRAAHDRTDRRVHIRLGRVAAWLLRRRQTEP